MGPIVLFDKSFLQALSVDEAVWFDHFFLANGGAREKVGGRRNWLGTRCGTLCSSSDSCLPVLVSRVLAPNAPRNFVTENRGVLGRKGLFPSAEEVRLGVNGGRVPRQNSLHGFASNGSRPD